MRIAPIGFALLALLAGPLALAQTTPDKAGEKTEPAQTAPADDFKPATTNQGGKQYPQVNSERRIRFRVVAPEAKSVRVPEWGGITLTKGEDGAWVGTSRPSTRASITTASTSTAPTCPTPVARCTTAPAAWAAASKSPPRTRTSTPPRTCRTAGCARRCTSPRAPTRRAAATSTRRPVTTRTPARSTRFCTFSTARAKTRRAGGTRGVRTSSWTT